MGNEFRALMIGNNVQRYAVSEMCSPDYREWLRLVDDFQCGIRQAVSDASRGYNLLPVRLQVVHPRCASSQSRMNLPSQMDDVTGRVSVQWGVFEVEVSCRKNISVRQRILYRIMSLAVIQYVPKWWAFSQSANFPSMYEIYLCLYWKELGGLMFDKFMCLRVMPACLVLYN